jgi:uncharacterized protein (TIGR03435 family)
VAANVPDTEGIGYMNAFKGDRPLSKFTPWIAALVIQFLVGAIGAPAVTPVFEIASVKENHSGRLGTDGFQVSHGSLTARNVSLKMLIQAAYHLQSDQVAGGPAWLGSDRYDILAKGMEDAAEQEVYSMLQPLLTERFNLVAHTVTRDLPLYSLEVGKGGTKLPRRDGGDCGAISVTPTTQLECGAIGTAGTSQRGWMTGRGVSPGAIADALSGFAGRMVVDRTGLRGNFDLNLSWTESGAQGPASRNGEEPRAVDVSELPGSIFTAVQEQLGLKLVAAKGPVQVFVIDRAEKPSGN